MADGTRSQTLEGITQYFSERNVCLSDLPELAISEGVDIGYALKNQIQHIAKHFVSKGFWNFTVQDLAMAAGLERWKGFYEHNVERFVQEYAEPDSTALRQLNMPPIVFYRVKAGVNPGCEEKLGFTFSFDFLVGDGYLEVSRNLGSNGFIVSEKDWIDGVMIPASINSDVSRALGYFYARGNVHNRRTVISIAPRYKNSARIKEDLDKVFFKPAPWDVNHGFGIFGINVERQSPAIAQYFNEVLSEGEKVAEQMDKEAFVKAFLSIVGNPSSDDLKFRNNSPMWVGKTVVDTLRDNGIRGRGPYPVGQDAWWFGVNQGYMARLKEFIS